MTKLSPIRVSGDQFRDGTGRSVILRGVNLGGDCKVPYPNGGTNFPSDFSDHLTVSFIGRPFPAAEADEHFGRLAHWGFNCVRLLTTWEAVEHAGPGRYDAPYLDYLAELARRAGEHGLYVFIDFHQDVWSRMTGGDGAPGWVFGALSLDFTKFHAAGAAHVMQYKYDYARGGRQDTYPQMSWGTNYRMPANAIMWTLFWGGRMFTPDFRVDGQNVQDFLQQHYLGAMDAIARRLKDLPNVLGFDTLNEPGIGWFGQPLSYRHVSSTATDPARPRPGPALSPLDAIAAMRGVPVSVPLLKRNPQTSIAEVAGETTVNPDGVSIWHPGVTCPFERAGAYRIEGGAPVARNEDFFRVWNGKAITISENGFGPFFHEVARVIRAHQPEWSVFAELDAFGAAFGRPFPKTMPERTVNADHWYDAATLYLKTFDVSRSPDMQSGEVATGKDAVRARFTHQIGGRAKPAKEFTPKGAPSLIGEFGIPFDLDGGEAYREWSQGKRDVWSKHVQALELMYDALDALLLNSTQWNYTASNSNDLMVGDGWNQEDLSVFSRDQQDDPSNPDSGGRAIEGFCRPFVRTVQGRLVSVRFEREAGVFTAVFDADPSIAAPTEIYVPKIQFPSGVRSEIRGTEAPLVIEGQIGRIAVTARGRISITLHRR